MSDIREHCPISCIAHETSAYSCDDSICLKRKAYIQGKTDTIDELFNTEMITGMTLKDVYEEAPINEFDEGWNKCYEDFVEVAERIKERKE